MPHPARPGLDSNFFAEGVKAGVTSAVFGVWSTTEETMADSKTSARIGIASFLLLALCVSVSLLPHSSEDASGMSFASSLLQNGKATHNISSSSSSNSANRSDWARMKVQKHLKLCAAKITGDSTPRHLDPTVRAKVGGCLPLWSGHHQTYHSTSSPLQSKFSSLILLLLKMMFGRLQVLQCVNNYMPPMHLKKNLEEGSKQLIDAATTDKEKVDAQEVISKVKTLKPI
jgi:hypothetical protein